MKTIAELKGADFLRRINHIRKAVAEPLQELDIMTLMRTPAPLTGDETDEEKAAKVNEQTKANINAALDRALEEKPEETIKLLDLLIIHENGEELDGLDYMLAAIELLTNEKVVNFLSSLMRSGLLN